jgi:hypothetical protein
MHYRLLNLPVRFGLQVTFASGCPRVKVVDERYAVADKDVVFDLYALTDKGMAGDLAAAAYARIFLNLNEGTDFRLVSDLAAIQIDELRELHILS